MAEMKEINYKDMKFNPFNLIGGEWMLITAGDEHSYNTMTASWGHLGCLWVGAVMNEVAVNTRPHCFS